LRKVDGVADAARRMCLCCTGLARWTKGREACLQIVEEWGGVVVNEVTRGIAVARQRIFSERSNEGE
jgi:hypothetical protein